MEEERTEASIPSRETESEASGPPERGSATASKLPVPLASAPSWLARLIRYIDRSRDSILPLAILQLGGVSPNKMNLSNLHGDGQECTPYAVRLYLLSRPSSRSNCSLCATRG